MLTKDFFNRDACIVAQELIGKVLRHRYQGQWLAARIIETESYYLNEKASHSSKGHTPSRRAMFMAAGTIYMYYSRGGDSLNISCGGEGNAVLVKSAYPHTDRRSPQKTIEAMQVLNPLPSGETRPLHKLCAGQTLMCKSLNLKVPQWNAQPFDKKTFYVEDVGYRPKKLINTRRLGIPKGRDDHLMYRYVDFDAAKYCTSNPLTKRSWKAGDDYILHLL